MKIVYDTKLMRPGCVLLQATHGCDPALAHRFDTKHWLLAPTENLSVYPITDVQLDQLVDMTNERAVL